MTRRNQSAWQNPFKCRYAFKILKTAELNITTRQRNNILHLHRNLLMTFRQIWIISPAHPLKKIGKPRAEGLARSQRRQPGAHTPRQSHPLVVRLNVIHNVFRHPMEYLFELFFVTFTVCSQTRREVFNVHGSFHLQNKGQYYWSQYCVVLRIMSACIDFEIHPNLDLTMNVAKGSLQTMLNWYNERCYMAKHSVVWLYAPLHEPYTFTANFREIRRVADDTLLNSGIGRSSNRTAGHYPQSMSLLRDFYRH